MQALLDTVSPLLVPLVLLGLSAALGRFITIPSDLIRDLGFLPRLSLYTLCGCVAFSWIGTILAVLGAFHWWLLFIILSLVVILAQRDAQRIMRHERASVRRERTHVLVQALLVCLLLGIGWLFSRPAESFFVFNDAAVYTIGGVALSRTGSLLFRPHTFWNTSGEFLRQFFFTDPFGMLSRHYGPFYQWMPRNQALEIGFLPLPKVWMALTAWLFGPGGATWGIPFWGILGSALLYNMTERMLGRGVGFGTVILLSATLPQIWFARYPTSEMPSQVLILGGLYLLTLARQNASRPIVANRLAVWSALALAGLTILRFEALLLLFIFSGLMMVGWVREFPELPGFARTWLVCLVVVSGIGMALSIGAARYYLFTRALEITPILVRASLLILLVGAVLFGLGWQYRRRASLRRLSIGVRQAVSRYLPLAIAVGWLVWSGIASWQLISRETGKSLAGWLAQYWTLPGLAVSLLGALWMLWQAWRRTVSAELLALLGLTVVLLVGFSIRTFVYPIQPWAVRRLVPVVMPTLALTMASILTMREFTFQSAHTSLPRRSVRWLAMGLSVLLVTSLAALVGQRSLPVLFHRERAGLWKQLKRIDEAFAEDAVLLFDNGNASQGLTPTMELVLGRVSLVIQQSPPIGAGSALDGVIEGALDQNRPVYLVVTNGDLAWWPDRWTFLENGAFEIQVPVLRQPEGRRPVAEDVVTQTLLLDTYQIRPSTERVETLGANSTLDVPAAGAGSYPFLRGGFYGWYKDAEGRLTRWTDGQAVIKTPWPAMRVDEAASFCLQLHIAGGRPAGEAPAHVTLVGEDRALLEVELPKRFSPQTLTVPVTTLSNENEAQLEIQLISTTWDATRVGDERILGVLFYGMELMPLDHCVSD